MSNIVIRHTPILILGVGNGFVVVVTFGVDGDDVPSVKEAGEVAEHAEKDIDEGVGGADAGFDPDWWGRC